MLSNIFKSILLVSATCMATSMVISSPIEPIQRDDLSAHSVARSMMGSTNNMVSWESMQIERSPSDPELEELEKRIVYNPPIISPNSQTVWHSGQQETVKWTVDQSKIPADAKNYLVTIKLGYIHKDGRGGLNLKWTLAKDIPITDEEAEITVPTNLTAHSNFIIVVMGDSGNASKQFTIKTSSPSSNVKTNQATVNKCSNTTDDQTQKNASNGHPVVKERSEKAVSEREVNEKDTFAANMLGRDVQQQKAS